ncbi:DUF4832 domain-containing protein [Agarivorans sp. MS3-6]
MTLKLPRKIAIMAVSLLVVFNTQAASLEYQAAPVDNPLKGLVPYANEWKKERFPHSMEFRYIGMAQIMKGWGNFDWQAIEQSLNDSKKRGKQAIFRVYLEYPGKPTAIPQFLLDEGLIVTHWKTANQQSVITPNYADLRLRKAIRDFIFAMGEKYDGDPRIAFITAGILGLWGEWHTYPRTDLWADKSVQQDIITSYESAFRDTFVLLRYPAGENNPQYADNRTNQLGYHDDSFAWGTLDTGNPSEGWFFIPLLKQAQMTDKWKTVPIGGEIRPELWPTIFTKQPIKQQQNFAQCVSETHVSWLMDSGLFAERFTLGEERKKRAMIEVRKMGYELHVSTVTRKGDQLILKIENRGVAPFYYNWPIELRTMLSNGQTQTIYPDWELSQILPGKPVEWHIKIDSRATQISLRIPNPMEGGSALRFANKEYEGEWLKL